MDVQTPLICAGVVAVTSAVVYLSSVFGIRERTYEEAIEEQRRKNSLEVSGKSKSEKPKKEKKEKKKDKKEKKDKSKDKVDKGSTATLHTSEAKVGSAHQRDVSASRKTEHVEFKAEPEVVLLSEESASVELGLQRQISSNGKPIKPILTNKSEQICSQNQILNGNGQRNSFDQLLPKDELELLKEAKRTSDKQLLESVAEQSSHQTSDDKHLETPVVNGVNWVETESTQTHTHNTDNEVKPESNRSENSHNTSPVRRSKRSKQSLIDGNAKEVTAKTIVDLVKTVTLTNEEIQLLTDLLLNKQSDGSTEWRKKNDPLAVLKKQLQEKEVALEKSMKNLTAAVQKTRELRNELEVEKSKQLNGREKAQQMQIEIQALHMKLQQTFESHRSEMSTMQKQLQQIQVKFNEERSHSLRLQEDNSRLQQLVQNEQHLKHELDQLRNDRQQYEMRIAQSQKSNEELLRTKQQLDSRIKTMADSRQKDESTYQKHIKDVNLELQKCETQRNALVEELSHTSNKCNSLESETIQMRGRLKEVEDSKNDEINSLIEQLSQLNKEKQMLESALIETKQENQNIDQNIDKQELVRLSNDLMFANEQIESLKESLDKQIKLSDELSEKNRLANETIENFEKVKLQSIGNAVKQSEELTAQLTAESRDLRQQNESLTTKLNEALDSINKKIEQLESIKTELNVVMPGLNTRSDDWVSQIRNNFNDIIETKVSAQPSDEHKVKELESLLQSERDRSTEFQSKAKQFAETLSQTESILSELQQKIESQESIFRSREQELENELKSRSEENKRLNEQCKSLESSLAQIEEFKETIAEMEHKLKELQSKLSGEENEKRLLEQKYDEATKSVSNLSQELNEKTKEMEAFENEKSELDNLKAEFEELRVSLEKERKLSKDLNMQNIRLNSLVKIGHESLKMEEDKVRALEAKLNGNHSSPLCSATNGSSEAIPNANSSDNSEEAASAK